MQNCIGKKSKTNKHLCQISSRHMSLTSKSTQDRPKKKPYLCHLLTQGNTQYNLWQTEGPTDNREVTHTCQTAYAEKKTFVTLHSDKQS